MEIDVKRIACLSLLVCLFVSPVESAPQPRLPQDESIYIDEVRSDFLERITQFEKAKDWRGLFEMYRLALDPRRKSKTVRVTRNHQGRKVNQWISVVDYLVERFSKLPTEAYEVFRLEVDGRAKGALEQAKASGDLIPLEQSIAANFFSTYTDDALDFLANRHFQEGRVHEAVFYWDRLLRYYPDTDLPKAAIAARMAIACQEAGNRSAFEILKAWVKKDGKVGARTVFIGGQARKLDEVIEGVRFREVVSREASADKMPYLPEPSARFNRTGLGVRNDILRWNYDYSKSDGTSSKPRRRAPVIRRRGVPKATPINEFPYLPAYTRIRDRDYVIFSNGLRLIVADPRKARGDSQSRGVYWRYPRNRSLKVQTRRNSRGFGFTSPYIGATIDGEVAFVTLYSELKTVDLGPNKMDSYSGPTTLQAFHISTGRRLWNTETTYVTNKKGQTVRALEQYDFYERNWSFSSPPIVRGNRIFIGINTSPVGEQESRVLCLDKRTGRPLWCTFISSISGGFNRWWGGGTRFVAYLTMLAESGGTLYVQTNLGVVGALNCVTGNILWLTTYKRHVRVGNQRGETYLRPSNPPLLHRGTIFCLTQDSRDLKAFDANTGLPMDDLVEKIRTGGRRDLQWQNLTHLLRVDESWLVLGGVESQLINFRKDRIRVYPLAGANTSRCGRGILHRGFLYLSTYEKRPNEEIDGSLAIFSTKSWKMIEQIKWKVNGGYGNLMIAGDYLVVSTNNLSLYTDINTLTKEYVRKLGQSPPHAPVFLEYGDIMRENGRLAEAADSYLKFIEAAEGDARHAAKIRQVKLELYAIFLKRGLESTRIGNRFTGETRVRQYAEAVQHFRRAKGFAYDEATRTKATMELARSFERVGKGPEAIREYHQVIRKSRDAYNESKDGDSLEKAWIYAKKRISELVDKYGPEVYSLIEKEATAALAKIAKGDLPTLRKFVDLYPNSKAALEAFKKWIEGLWDMGRFDLIPSALRDFRRRYADQFNSKLWKKLIDALEKLGDMERLQRELPLWAKKYGKEVLQIGEEDITVEEYVQRKLMEIKSRGPGELPKPGPLKRIAMIPTKESKRTEYALNLDPEPLQTAGLRPASFKKDRVLLTVGSPVELWQIGEETKRIWTCAHPGAYLGAVYSDVGGGEDPGVKVTRILKGSPAEKAGLKTGDVIRTMDAATVTVENFHQELMKMKPGREIGLGVERGGKIKDLKLKLAAYPRDLLPRVVGATFTSDYALAVAWEDMIASIDLSDGSVRWTFGSIRSDARVGSFHSGDGFLFVNEIVYKRTGRDPLCSFTAEYLARRWPTSNARLLCLDDASGDVRWAKAFRIDRDSPKPAAMTFSSHYMDGSFAILWQYYLNRVSRSEIRVFNGVTGIEDASRRRQVNGILMAQAFDHDGRRFYWVDGTRTLRSVSLDPEASSARKRLSLSGKHFPSPYRKCALTASNGYVVLTVLTYSPTNRGKITVFNGDDFKEIRKIGILEGRTLPSNRKDLTYIGDDGVLYVYNLSDVKTAKHRSGFVTAYKLDDPKGKVIWDGPAPSTEPSSSSLINLVSMRGHVVFHARSGSMPGESSVGSSVVALQKSRGGYLVRKWDKARTPKSRAYTHTRVILSVGNRLFVSTEKGLEIYEE